MSVLVKGMRMPQSCYYCGLADTSFINCVAFEKPIVLEDDCEERRPDWCPLVEHGECQNVTREKREGVQFFAESGIVIQYIKDIVTDIQKEELMGDSTRLVSTCGDNR